jgi:energy-converting hydrogenase A subunit R
VFNGNDYAIKNANLAIISRNCMITPIIVELFEHSGLDKVREIAENWSLETLKAAANQGIVSQKLHDKFLENIRSNESFPLLVWLNEENENATIIKSKEIRKAVRGTAVGALG